MLRRYITAGVLVFLLSSCTASVTVSNDPPTPTAPTIEAVRRKIQEGLSK